MPDTLTFSAAQPAQVTIDTMVPAPNGHCYGRVLEGRDDGKPVFYAKLIDSSAQHAATDGPFASHAAAEARVIEYLIASKRFYGAEQ